MARRSSAGSPAARFHWPCSLRRNRPRLVPAQSASSCTTRCGDLGAGAFRRSERSACRVGDAIELADAAGPQGAAPLQQRVEWYRRQRAIVVEAVPVQAQQTESVARQQTPIHGEQRAHVRFRASRPSRRGPGSSTWVRRPSVISGALVGADPDAAIRAHASDWTQWAGKYCLKVTPSKRASPSWVPNQHIASGALNDGEHGDLGQTLFHGPGIGGVIVEGLAGFEGVGGRCDET